MQAAKCYPGNSLQLARPYAKQIRRRYVIAADTMIQTISQPNPARFVLADKVRAVFAYLGLNVGK